MVNTYTSSLPNQITNKRRYKNDELAKRTVDVLEGIARRQIQENQKYKDFYDMVDGKLVWADYTDEDLSTLDAVSALKNDNIEIPTFVKHYDILGMIVNQIVGEWVTNQDDFDIDCVDEYTDNEFIRERSRRLNEYVMQRFQLEFKQVLAERGISEQGEFQNEEEQQQHIQLLQEIRDSIKTPQQIEKEMKDWKTEAVSWGNGVIEGDKVRYRMESLHRSEMTDYALTGRFFRNYFIGLDYYKPERWDVLEVFFSRESDAVKPQDREYVGRQFRLPLYKIRERYGHKLNKSELKRIDNYFSEYSQGEDSINLSTRNGLMRALYPQNEQLPFYNYHDFEEAYEVQELTGHPKGINIIQTEDGEEREPYYLPDYLDYSPIIYGGYSTRNDYKVRRDSVLITEGYYRSYKKIYIANFKNSDGRYITETFSDELLPEFIEKHGLKKDNRSLEEVIKEMEGDKIFVQHQPVIRQFVKINIGKTVKDSDSIYIDEEMPFQIKGNSEFCDAIIPVGGIIDSSSIGMKIRPYQVNYNINLNQIISCMEKELGMFWAFDINLLPAEFKGQGDSEDTLLRIQELIKTTSMVPLDFSKGNTGYGVPQSNSFIPHQISFANDINYRMQWSEIWKSKAIEQIGITPQRMGNPNKYETATGIQQGVEASYAQTTHIFSKMTQAYLESMEVHLSVAQYCQKNYKDADFVYTKSDNTRGYVYLSDPAFPLRRFGVFPVNSSKNKLQRQQLVQTLLNLNTLGADILDYAEIFTAQSTQEILDRARKARNERIQEEREAQERQLENTRLTIEAQEREKQAEREFKAEENQKDRESEIVRAQLNALGRASYSEGTTEEENINLVAEQNLKEIQIKGDLENKSNKLKFDRELAIRKADLEQERNDLKRQEIQQRSEASKNDIQREAINYKQ